MSEGETSFNYTDGLKDGRKEAKQDHNVIIEKCQDLLKSNGYPLAAKLLQKLIK